MSFSDDLNRCVRILVRNVLGLGENDVRIAEQTAPAGQQSAAYATVEIISTDEDGMPSTSYEHDDPEDEGQLTEISMVPERFVASVNFYGTTPRAAELRGAQVSDDVDDYTGVTDGAFGITIDGSTRQVTGLDFSDAESMEDVADVLETRLAAALASTGATWTGKRFLVTSPTTGQASAVGPAVAPSGAGTDVSTLLGLTAAAGAVGAANKSGIAKPSMEAFDRARRLVRRLSLSSSVELMQKLGIGYEDASPVRDLSELQPGGAFEGRGQVDLTFSVISRETVVIGDVDDEQIQIAMLAQSPGGAIHNIEPEVTP